MGEERRREEERRGEGSTDGITAKAMVGYSPSKLWKNENNQYGPPDLPFAFSKSSPLIA